LRSAVAQGAVVNPVCEDWLLPGAGLNMVDEGNDTVD